VAPTIQGAIDNFKQDDLSVFEPARPILAACLLGRSGPPEKRKKANLWPYVAVLAAVILAFAGWRLLVRSRWNSFFEALRAQPGIAITAIERRRGWYQVSGLKDPQAADPAQLLAARGLDAGEVHFTWQPFLSLAEPFASKRAQAEAIGHIQRQVIRFDPGSSRLLISEAARIEELAREISEVLQASPGARIAVTGHADETGSPATNDKLSAERATQVAEALTSQGIQREILKPSGAGNSRPIRQGTGEWDRATNRGVSFTVSVQ